MKTEEECELDAAIARVMDSPSRKKLIVAGPGAGKTTLFRKLLDQAPGVRDQRLVLTFINNLKVDLERSLGGQALVHTLHGYCQLLLHRHAELRGGLTAEFDCYPGLVGLIKQDWRWLNESPSPSFVDRMRDLSVSDADEQFFFGRSDYYNAVDFDDSVYRVAKQLAATSEITPAYELVLIDEFQDFNRMEAEVINHLGRVSPLVVAGDDDQALYSQLRGASWDHIRAHHAGGEFEVFELPFCMRCPAVIVGAINDVIIRARAINNLEGRIDKPFRFFPPVKGADSEQFPYIELVRTSVQSSRANYFGKYVEQAIRAIPEEAFAAAADKSEPCVLIIGPKPYLPQIEHHLISVDLLTLGQTKDRDSRNDALLLIHDNPNSNLGWRILLSSIENALAREWVRAAAAQQVQLADVIPEARRAAWLAEAAEAAARRAEAEGEEDPADETPPIKLTSYEGSKGLSAQYVILAGLHDGDLPRRANAIRDIEICKFLVGLTRTKKQCTVLATGRFGTDRKILSSFIGWIALERFHTVNVDAAYWNAR